MQDILSSIKWVGWLPSCCLLRLQRLPDPQNQVEVFRFLLHMGWQLLP